MAKITKGEYIKAKEIVDAFEEQERKESVWECNKDLYMKQSKTRVFTKGYMYKQLKGFSNLAFKDDRGDNHTAGKWEKHFILQN